MTGLDQFRKYTDQALSGLKADDALKQRILLAAASKEQAGKRPFSFKPVPVLCSLTMILIVGIFILNGKSPVFPNHNPRINTFAAGRTVYSVALVQSSLSKCLDDGLSFINERVEATI